MGKSTERLGIPLYVFLCSNARWQGYHEFWEVSQAAVIRPLLKLLIKAVRLASIAGNCLCIRYDWICIANGKCQVGCTGLN